MKIALVILSVLFMSAFVQASPKVTNDIECDSGDQGDEGYKVVIRSDSSAVLFVIDPGGKREVRTYNVTEKVTSRAQTFKAKNFSLAIGLKDTFADLKAIDDFGLPLELVLFCEFN